MQIVDAHKYACGGVCRIVNEQENDQSVLKKSCSHRFAAGRIRPVCGPVAGPAWRSFLSQRERPTGPWLQRWLQRRKAVSPKRFARRAGFLCSHRPVAGPPPLRFSQQKERPTGPWLQWPIHLTVALSNETPPNRTVVTACHSLRTIDVHDFALVRPIVSGCNKPGSDRVVTDVLPFLPVAFVAAQNVVETTLLPHLRTLSS